jgi:hypothetical protein
MVGNEWACRFAGEVWVLDLVSLGPTKCRKPILTETSKTPEKYKMPSPVWASEVWALVKPHRCHEHWLDLTGEPAIRHPGKPRLAQTLPHNEPWPHLYKGSTRPHQRLTSTIRPHWRTVYQMPRRA